MEDLRAENQFKELCRKYSQDNIHWVKSELNKLIWQRSQEKDEIHTTKYSVIELVNKPQNIVIISDIAGMGKSTMLSDVERQLKKPNMDFLVFRIDLNKCTNQLKNVLRSGHQNK